jgi:transglutaminase-like putative cysteine protease
MKPPPLLLGAALMFWGWQTELWIIALLMALILEGSRLIRLRWDLSAADFRRISDLCSILLVILLVYLYMSDTSAYFIYVLIKWLPIVSFPLLAAQTYATSGRINLQSLFLLRRKKKKKDKEKPRTKLSLTYPYFALCILSAGAANNRDIYFYIGLLVLSALAFWFMRSRRFSAWLWICLISIAAGAGAVGHVGLHGLHLTLEEKGLEWFNNSNRQGLDPFKTRTAIGDIGSLKPSNRIVFRVKPEGERPSSMLMREAIYSSYSYSMWFAPKASFRTIQPDTNGTSWQFRRGLSQRQAITVYSYLHKGQGVLKLPDGAFQVDQLPVVTMERNKLGTVKVEGGPSLVGYRIQYDSGIAGESPPAAADLRIPDKEKPTINKIVNDLGLAGKSPRVILNRIETFFQENFSYSLELRGKGGQRSPLSNFLLQTRSGHCEYFATASVLLLRAAGIPARYVKGYSVHEFSRLENRFIVRDRHAHAWTLVHVGGTWHSFDTTPAAWTSIEEAATPGYKIVSDFLSFCRFKFSEGLSHLRQSGQIKHLWWLILPLVYIVVRRILRIKRSRRPDAGKPSGAGAAILAAGSDSEFYSIEKALNSSGFFRHPSETLQNWIKRLQKDQSASQRLDKLGAILNLHYRYRFDPQGINATERTALKTGAQAWLQKYNPPKSSRK